MLSSGSALGETQEAGPLRLQSFRCVPAPKGKGYTKPYWEISWLTSVRSWFANVVQNFPRAVKKKDVWSQWASVTDSILMGSHYKFWVCNVSPAMLPRSPFACPELTVSSVPHHHYFEILLLSSKSLPRRQLQKNCLPTLTPSSPASLYSYSAPSSSLLFSFLFFSSSLLLSSPLHLFLSLSTTCTHAHISTHEHAPHERSPWGWIWARKRYIHTLAMIVVWQVPHPAL